MDLLPLILVPLITALIAPIALEVVRKWLNKRKDKSDIAAELRDELRVDNKALRDRNSELEKAHTEHMQMLFESEEWKKRFYQIKKEKQHLEFELTLLQREIDHIRRQHEEYTAIRERAERQFDQDSPA